MSYCENKQRVFGIYGINPKDGKYDCHHIVHKSDPDKGIVSKNFDLNGLSNLTPLEKKIHCVLHQKIIKSENT